MAAEGKKSSEQETQTVDDNGAGDGEEVQTVQEEKEETVHTGTTENRKRKSKPRATTSKKERRRTQNINAAFGDLRNHIPNVPADTKLSKIKTLKLAMSYIRHLEKILNSEEGQAEPKLERKYSSSSETEAESVANNNSQQNGFGFDALVEDSRRYRRRSTRTGWPQHVWALELMSAKKPRTMVQQSV